MRVSADTHSSQAVPCLSRNLRLNCFLEYLGQSPDASLNGHDNGDGDGDGDEDEDHSEAVVAIKQFKGLTDMEDEHTRDYVRLTQEREAGLARALIHPNIVRCLGTLTAREASASPEGGGGGGGGGGDGVAFLIFEHVPGTLLDLIQERPGGLSLSEVRRWRSIVLRNASRNSYF